MIYLHIGKAKTGTTSIQQGLHQNRNSLLQHNVLYPLSGLVSDGHHNLYYEQIGSDKFDPSKGGLDQLLAEINAFNKKNPSGDIIISTETLEALPIASFTKIYKALNKVDTVNVILVLRRQDHFLTSKWAMDLSKMWHSQDLQTWVSTKLSSSDFNLNYDERVKEFQSLAPKENLVLLGFRSMVKDGLFNSILQVCGLNSDHYQAPRRLKQSLNNYELLVLQYYAQKFGTKLTAHRKNKLLKCVKAISNKYSWNQLQGAKPKVTQDTYESIKSTFATLNEKLLKLYPKLKEELSYDEYTHTIKQPSLKDIPSDHLLHLGMLLFSISKDKN